VQGIWFKFLKKSRQLNPILGKIGQRSLDCKFSSNPILLMIAIVICICIISPSSTWRINSCTLNTLLSQLLRSGGLLNKTSNMKNFTPYWFVCAYFALKGLTQPFTNKDWSPIVRTTSSAITACTRLKN